MMFSKQTECVYCVHLCICFKIYSQCFDNNNNNNNDFFIRTYRKYFDSTTIHLN